MFKFLSTNIPVSWSLNFDHHLPDDMITNEDAEDIYFFQNVGDCCNEREVISS